MWYQRLYRQLCNKFNAMEKSEWLPLGGNDFTFLKMLMPSKWLLDGTRGSITTIVWLMRAEINSWRQMVYKCPIFQFWSYSHVTLVSQLFSLVTSVPSCLGYRLVRIFWEELWKRQEELLTSRHVSLGIRSCILARLQVSCQHCVWILTWSLLLIRALEIQAQPTCKNDWLVDCACKSKIVC